MIAAAAMLAPGIGLTTAVFTNTPHVANPSADASNPSSFGIISSTANTGREGIDERLIRLGF